MSNKATPPQIPPEQVQLLLGGIGAASPFLYTAMIQSLADQHQIPYEEASKQIEAILKTLPSPMD